MVAFHVHEDQELLAAFGEVALRQMASTVATDHSRNQEGAIGYGFRRKDNR
jgi:hypothetical protein